MTNSNTTSRNINLSANVNHDYLTLYNDCKVKKNLLLFSVSDKKSTAIEGTQKLIGIENSTLKNSVDVLKYMQNNLPKGSITIAWIQATYQPIEEKELNRSCSRLYRYFDHEKPIIHIAITKYGEVDVSNADLLRLEGKRALNRIGVNRGVIFDMDINRQGNVHFHAFVQGYLKKYKYALKRTGWGYHRFENDRRDYLNDFVPTVRYCLEKPRHCKRAYLRI